MRRGGGVEEEEGRRRGGYEGEEGRIHNSTWLVLPALHVISWSFKYHSALQLPQ